MGAAGAYVELHAHSYYSLLDGVPSPEALVARAAELGMPALALTDHDALYGAPHFALAAEQTGIKPIFGTELTLGNGAGHLTLLAENVQGYANLCQLITLARRDQPKGLASLPWRRLVEHAQGLIALSGCRRGQIARSLLAGDFEAARRTAERYAAIFGRENFFLELQRHHLRGDRRLNEGLARLAEQLGLRLVATGNVHYLAGAQAPLVVDVFHIALDECEGFVHLPCPLRRVDALPPWTPRRTAVPPQDVADGMGRQGYPAPLQVQRQATPP